MKCPNCGKRIRSKTQCAHCGTVFDGQNQPQAHHQSVENQASDTHEYRDYVAELEVQDAYPQDYTSEKGEPDYTRSQEDDEDFLTGQPVYIPNSAEEDEAYDQDFVPETPRRGTGVLGVLGGILKFLLLLALVFCIFYFGPSLVRQLSQRFSSEDASQVQAPEPAPAESPDPEPGQDPGQEEPVGGLASDAASGEGQELAASQTDESQDPEEAAEEERLVDVRVNTDNYPVVEIALDFNESLATVTHDTFSVYGLEGEEEFDITDAVALSKEGNTLYLSFNDPTLDVVSTQPIQQMVVLRSNEEDFSQEISYEVPSRRFDQESLASFNEILNENLADLGDVSAVISEVDSDKLPYVYDSQVLPAGNMIAWFILQATYEQVEAGQLNLTDRVTLDAALIAEGDEGSLSQQVGEEVSLEEVINRVILERDYSGMNHLIAAIGGPNAFNIWLNESNYFATRISDLLSISPSGMVTGAVTDVQDIHTLLTDLALDQWVSEEADAAMKDQLLLTPITEKFPLDFPLVIRRFELANGDANEAQQYYAGILETEETRYIVAILVNNIDNAQATVQGIADTIQQGITYAETGEVTPLEGTGEPEEAASLEEELAPDTPDEDLSPVQETPSQQDTSATGPGSGQYYPQYVEGQGQYVDLPDRSIINEQGIRVEPTWFFDEATQTYRYTFN